MAESLVNPFGDDDDDFELNWMVDRNLQVMRYFISFSVKRGHFRFFANLFRFDFFTLHLKFFGLILGVLLNR